LTAVRPKSRVSAALLTDLSVTPLARPAAVGPAVQVTASDSRPVIGT